MGRIAQSLRGALASEPGGTGLITECLQQWRAGDADVLPRLTTAVYRELRRLAGSIMRGHADRSTIQPTALVHELYIRLPGVQHFDWQSRTQFLNVAAGMMRNILVDHARKRQSLKRGGQQITLTPETALDPGLGLDILTVHEALERFAVDYPRQARIVELRFFGGLTLDESVDVMSTTGWEVSKRTVGRDWTFARAWLKNAIERGM